jgi:hypothetical protein
MSIQSLSVKRVEVNDYVLICDTAWRDKGGGGELP